MKYLSVSLFVVFTIMCAKNSKESKAFIVFNEGVKFSLDAVTEYEKGNYENSEELNKKAIIKFLEVTELDSSHHGAFSALGHSYYLTREFPDCIKWFELAQKHNPNSAANYRECGLCRINLGDIEAGKKDIEKAFELENGSEIRVITMIDLMDIGRLAFENGIGYEKQGDTENGIGYKKFSVGVLYTAHQFDPENIEILKLIIDFTEQLGDLETSNNFKEILKKL